MRSLGRLTCALLLVICGLVAAPAAQAEDPLSDADGDGLPYKWETPPPATSVTTTATTDKGKGSSCKRNQRHHGGKCVPKCKKGKKLKRGKCVKRKKPAKKGRGGKASVSALPEPASVASLGADPNHKDIFVEIDYANATLRQNTACSELDAIVAAFADAPVSNPDGRTGIDLHIDAGVSCPSRSYDLGGSRIFNGGACPNTGTTFQNVELPESRIGTFHIAGFSPTCGGGGGEGGAANFLGTKSVIFTDGFSFAHVLMHELGHNLGLDHPYPGQPNRLSTMNTRLYTSPNNGNTAVDALDFQRFALPALDENNLSEEAGISAPPEAHKFFLLHYCANTLTPSFVDAWPADGAIDWNCNSPEILLPGQQPTIDPGTISADVNGDGQKTVLPATSNEWVALQYASGGQIGPR